MALPFLLTFNSDVSVGFKAAMGGSYVAGVIATIVLINFADDEFSKRDFMLIGSKTDP